MLREVIRQRFDRNRALRPVLGLPPELLVHGPSIK